MIRFAAVILALGLVGCAGQDLPPILQLQDVAVATPVSCIPETIKLPNGDPLVTTAGQTITTLDYINRTYADQKQDPYAAGLPSDTRVNIVMQANDERAETLAVLTPFVKACLEIGKAPPPAN